MKAIAKQNGGCDVCLRKKSDFNHNHSMKPQMNLLGRFLAIVAIVNFVIATVISGGPGKPQPLTSEQRSANAFFLRFQDMLASENWKGALGMCSDRVQAHATQWRELGEFFHQTIPINDLLAQSFGCWSCGTKAFGLVVNLTPPNEQPIIQWYWAIISTNGGWVVDYPPVNMDDYVISEKKFYKNQQTQAASIRHDLEVQMRNLKVQLTALSDKFVIGSPMLFKIELINFGKESVDYSNFRFYFEPLKVMDASNKDVPYRHQSGQIPNSIKTIEPNSTAVLVEKTDLSERYTFTQPGKYYVQFSGSSLEIGKQVPHTSHNSWLLPKDLLFLPDFLKSTTQLPSNILEIEILTRDGK